MFQQMLEQIKHDVASILVKVQVRSAQQLDEMEEHNRQPQPDVQYQHADADSSPHPQAGPDAEAEPEPAQQQPYRRQGRKIGRNEPCWCGSGKKFKQCHGRLT